jgi:hypothetical protein
MKQPKKYIRVSISLYKDYKEKLTYLAELEHRRLSQQIVHMTEFYLKHQVETKKLLEQFIQNQYDLYTSTPEFIEIKTNKPIEVEAKPHRLKTSQVLQENKGIIVSDVPEKKAKREFENLSS